MRTPLLVLVVFDHLHPQARQLHCLPDIRGSEEASGEALPLAWCHKPTRAILVGADGLVGTLETTLYPEGGPRAATSRHFFLYLFTRVRRRRCCEVQRFALQHTLLTNSLGIRTLSAPVEGIHGTAWRMLRGGPEAPRRHMSSRRSHADVCATRVETSRSVRILIVIRDRSPRAWLS